MDSDIDIELPADWQEGVASFLTAFAENDGLSFDQLLPSKLETDAHSSFDTDSLAAGVVMCPYLENPWGSSSMLEHPLPSRSPSDVQGQSSGPQGPQGHSSIEDTDALQTAFDNAAAASELKKRKLREKNRRAQQTYRNKQKRVIQGFSSNLEELNLRIQQLEKEKLDLETRNKMLRRVWRPTSELVTPPLGAEGKFTPVPSSPVDFEAVRHFFALVLPDEAYKLTTGYISEITVDTFVRFWHEYTAKLRGFLEAGAEDLESPAYKQLEELILAQRSHSLPFVPEDPTFAAIAIAAWDQIKREAEEPPTREWWIRVLDALQLSREQKQSVVVIHCHLLARCEALLEERQDILASLHRSLPTYSKVLMANPGQVYASHEAKRLALNLEHEKRAVLACKRDFRCAILTPLQEARGIVAGSPHAMDVRALCELVGEDEAVLEDPG